MQLLLVESDIEDARLLSRSLTRKLHDVAVARDGRDALFLLSEDSYDGVILNRRLPRLDGIQVLKELRNRGDNVPVIMVSGWSDAHEVVVGLNAGADDYCVMPVDIEELDARLAAVSRRPAVISEFGILRAGSIEINLLQHKVTRRGASLSLLPLELKVLAALVRNAHQIMSREMIVAEVWGAGLEPAANIVDAKITRIRAKLNYGSLPDAIVTVRGTGYMLSEAA